MDDPASSILLFFAVETAAVEPATWLSIALKILAVLVLVLLNGFFVARICLCRRATLAYRSARRRRQ